MPKLPKEMTDKIVMYTDLETAIKAKNIYSVKKFYDIEIHNMEWAAKTGDLEIMKTIYKLDNKFKSNTIYEAVSHRNLEIIEWLFGKKCDTVSITQAIVYYNHYDGINWLFRNSIDVSKALDKNAESVDLYTVDHLFWKGYQPSDYTIERLMRYGEFDVIKLWIDFGLKLTAKAMQFAVPKQDLEVIEYLYKNGAPVEEDIIDYAIGIRNNLDVIKWLHEMGGKYTNYSLNQATRSGNLELVKFLTTHCEKMHDPETNNDSLMIAKSHRHYHIVDYLKTLEPEVRLPLIPIETLFL